ncbi:hypothetical protein H5410_047150, partial [Solanum commersonii]
MTREVQIAKMENQKVLNGRVFDPDILTEPGMSTLFYSVSRQSWDHLFEPSAPYLHELKVREFYYKMELLDDGGIRTIVRDVKIHLDEKTLGIILGVPVKGICPCKCLFRRLSIPKVIHIYGEHNRQVDQWPPPCRKLLSKAFFQDTRASLEDILS